MEKVREVIGTDKLLDALGVEENIIKEQNNMEIQLSEEKIQEMVEGEIRKCVDRKIQCVMDNGCANWFSQQNIKMITERAITNRISPKIIEDIIRGIDKKELLDKFSNSVSKEIVKYLFVDE